MFSEMVLIPREEYERMKKARQEVLTQGSGGAGAINVIQQWSKSCPPDQAGKPAVPLERDSLKVSPPSPLPARPPTPPSSAGAPQEAPRPTPPSPVPPAPSPASPAPAPAPVPTPVPALGPGVQLPVAGLLPRLVPFALGPAPSGVPTGEDVGGGQRHILQKSVEADIPSSFERWDEHVAKILDVISSGVRGLEESTVESYENLEKRLDDLQQNMHTDLLSGLKNIPGDVPSAAPQSDEALVKRVEELYSNHFDELHANIMAQEASARKLSTELLARLSDIEKTGVREPVVGALKEGIQASFQDLVGKLEKLVNDSSKYQEEQQRKNFDLILNTVKNLNERRKQELGEVLEQQRVQRQEELRQQRELLEKEGGGDVGALARNDFLLRSAGEEDARLRGIIDQLLQRLSPHSEEGGTPSPHPPITNPPVDAGPPVELSPKEPSLSVDRSSTKPTVSGKRAQLGARPATATTTTARPKITAKTSSPLPRDTKKAFEKSLNNDLKRTGSVRAAQPGVKKEEKKRIKDEPGRSGLRGQGPIRKLKPRARRRLLSSLRKLIQLQPLTGKQKTCT